MSHIPKRINKEKRKKKYKKLYYSILLFLIEKPCNFFYKKFQAFERKRYNKNKHKYYKLAVNEVISYIENVLVKYPSQGVELAISESNVDISLDEFFRFDFWRKKNKVSRKVYKYIIDKNKSFNDYGNDLIHMVVSYFNNNPYTNIEFDNKYNYWYITMKKEVVKNA
ncbi:putative secreted/membrane protein [Bacillus phage AR9]|uniref:Uncharacterized protein n=2 Tax=Bacillus phage PBS1 TaxID=10683 RepID=A0A223LCZ0_BPPB1|nr:putative secreted/membrane protein [Bacillus phage AR9]YP_009664227.1 hypothetical protein FK780_gp025 [Bacillus phage PBS1]AMS01222.1 putative secreted/membrane protein [Bacillus phage AR9]AST99847.1 hypothetical protein PBI_PBS1_25 [Bacillus phage PBS1]BDE75333.1 hypothetical protein [Bacillus phage PBS1]